MKKLLLIVLLFSLNNIFALSGRDHLPRSSAAVVTGAILGAGLGVSVIYLEGEDFFFSSYPFWERPAMLEKAAIVGMAVGAGMGAIFGGIIDKVFSK